MQFNNWTGFGNLGRDADTGRTSGGTFFARFSIGMNKTRKVNGQPETATTWIECNFYGERAEKIAQWLTKGKGVLVQGSLEERSFTTKTGVDVKKHSILVSDVQFLPKSAESAALPVRQTDDFSFDTSDELSDDEVPF